MGMSMIDVNMVAVDERDGWTERGGRTGKTD